MYGLVNIAVQELVEERFGKETWQKIKAKAEVTVPEFARMSPYPDEVTYRLVGAASAVLGVPAEQVLELFGEFWVLFTGQKGYGTLFSMSGGSLREFLYNLDELHTRVGQNFPHLVPPSFSFDELSATELRMHYFSERAGLCPMVVGLVRGLSLRFKTEVQMTHPVCQVKGADHCEFLLTLPPVDAR